MRPYITWDELRVWLEDRNEYHTRYVMGMKFGEEEKQQTMTLVPATRQSGLKVDVLACDDAGVEDETFHAMAVYFLTGVIPNSKVSLQDIIHMRDTINNMYEDLKNKGWLQGKIGRGDYSYDQSNQAASR